MKEHKNTTTTATTTAPRQYRHVWELSSDAEEMTLCEVVRHISLRAMHQSTGHSPALDAIILGCYTDKAWSDTANRQTTADTLRRAKDTERAEADKARAFLRRIRTTEEQRAEAKASLDYHTALADNHLGEAEDIENDNSTLTASLAQDMLHTIYIALQDIKTNPDLQTEEAFGYLCTVAKRYIYDLTSVNILDRLNRIYRPLSKSEAIYLMTRYGVNPQSRPRQKWTQTAKGCTGYYTLEAHTRKKDLDPRKVDPAIIATYATYNEACVWFYEHMTLPTTHSTHTTAFPALDAKSIASRMWHRQTPAQKQASLGLDPAEDEVLYLVLNVPTIRTHHSTEALTDHDPRTAEQVTEATLASVDVIALAERANLGQQARKAVEALTHPEAHRQADEARKAVLAKGEASLAKLQEDRAKAGKKPYAPGKVRQMRKQFEETAEHAYTSTLWAYALTLAEYTPTAQAKAKSIILGKLSKAYRTAPDELTPGKVDFSKLMRSGYRGHSQNPGKPLDLVQVWQTLGAQTPRHKPVVAWTESEEAPEATNPGKDYREAEVLLRDSYRATAPKATPPALTPKEQRERERLARNDAEIANLWRQFSLVDMSRAEKMPRA